MFNSHDQLVYWGGAHLEKKVQTLCIPASTMATLELPYNITSEHEVRHVVERSLSSPSLRRSESSLALSQEDGSVSTTLPRPPSPSTETVSSASTDVSTTVDGWQVRQLSGGTTNTRTVAPPLKYSLILLYWHFKLMKQKLS